jgi:hypothetical protein
MAGPAPTSAAMAPANALVYNTWDARPVTKSSRLSPTLLIFAVKSIWSTCLIREPAKSLNPEKICAKPKRPPGRKLKRTGREPTKNRRQLCYKRSKNLVAGRTDLIYIVTTVSVLKESTFPTSARSKHGDSPIYVITPHLTSMPIWPGPREGSTVT